MQALCNLLLSNDLLSCKNNKSVNLKEIENNLFDCYEVYDFKGLKIKTCSSKDELKNLKGVFVVKCYSQGIYLKTIKLSRL